MGECGGICTSDGDGDGVCDELELSGCDDPLACNFNTNATDNDGSCVFPETECATCNPDGTVDYNDFDGDGICDDVDDCDDGVGCDLSVRPARRAARLSIASSYDVCAKRVSQPCDDCL